MLVYTFSTKVHYILENCRREVGISYLFPRVAVHQGTECRARELYKKMFQEAGIRRTTPTWIPQCL